MSAIPQLQPRLRVLVEDAIDTLLLLLDELDGDPDPEEDDGQDPADIDEKRS